MRSSTVQFPAAYPTRQPPRYQSASRFRPRDSAPQTLPPRGASAFACAHRQPLRARPPRASAASSPRRRPACRRPSRPDLFPQHARRAARAQPVLEAQPTTRLLWQSTRAASSYPTRPHPRETTTKTTLRLEVRACRRKSVGPGQRKNGPDMERAECYDLRGIAMAGTKITLEQVRHVARLARLEWSPEEEERLRADMDEMLAYVDKLNELDTKDVAPTTQVGEAGMPMRDDEVTNRPAADAMLANAPSRERGYFKVPKIIE